MGKMCIFACRRGGGEHIYIYIQMYIYICIYSFLYGPWSQNLSHFCQKLQVKGGFGSDRATLGR